MTELMRYQAYGEVLAFLGPPAPSYLQDLPAHLVLLLPHGDHWIETHSHSEGPESAPSPRRSAQPLSRLCWL